MCVTEYESSEIMIKHTAEIKTKSEDLFIFTLPAVHCGWFEEVKILLGTISPIYQSKGSHQRGPQTLLMP